MVTETFHRHHRRRHAADRHRHGQWHNNRSPTAVADVRTTNEDTLVSGNVLGNGSDITSGPIVRRSSLIRRHYAAGATATLSGIGTLSISNGAYTFTLAANHAGPVPVATYTVSDGSASSSSTLALSITLVADDPTLNINGTTITGSTVTTPGLPASTGLTLQFYDNIGALSPSNAGNIGTVESGVESTYADLDEHRHQRHPGRLGVDDAYRYTGYITCRRARTTAVGHRDDTLMVVGGGSVCRRRLQQLGQPHRQHLHAGPGHYCSRSSPTTATAPARWRCRCRSTAARRST